MELFKQEINFFISNSDIDQENDQEREHFKKCILLFIETLQRWTRNTPREFYKSQEILDKLLFIHNKIQLLLPSVSEVLLAINLFIFTFKKMILPLLPDQTAEFRQYKMQLIENIGQICSYLRKDEQESQNYYSEIKYYSLNGNPERKLVTQYIIDSIRKEKEKSIPYFIYKIFKIKRNTSFSKLLKEKNNNKIIKFLKEKYEEESETMNSLCK